MKRFDALITMQNTTALCKGVSGFFQKSDFSESCVFFIVISASKRFLCAIKQSCRMIFIFRQIIWGPIFRPLVRGVKIQFWQFWKIFSIFIYKTTPKNTWGSNLFQILRKMEELVPPPPTQSTWSGPVSHRGINTQKKLLALRSHDQIPASPPDAPPCPLQPIFFYAEPLFNWYWCFYLHRSKDLVSPACRIFLKSLKNKLLVNFLV